MGIIDITERCERKTASALQADFAHAARVAMLGELTASIATRSISRLHPITINGRWACGYSIAPSRIGLKCAN